MISASGMVYLISTRSADRYSIPIRAPRLDWHSSPYHRLEDLADLAGCDHACAGGDAAGAARELAGIGHRDLGSRVHDDAVDDVRRGRDQRQVKLALQP